MVRNPLFVQPNHSFDFGKKGFLSLSIDYFFYTFTPISNNPNLGFCEISIQNSPAIHKKNTHTHTKEGVGGGVSAQVNIS